MLLFVRDMVGSDGWISMLNKDSSGKILLDLVRDDNRQSACVININKVSAWVMLS